MKKEFTITIVLLLVATSLFAQDRPESYNYQRGMEAMQNENTEEAMEYFTKDVKDNPKNGYSYSWMALLYKLKEDYGQALSAVDLALKYLPKKDKEYVVFAYTTRSDVYLHLEDTTKAIADMTTAIKVDPEETDSYEKRAQIYYEQDQYALADADYKKIIELKPGDVMGYMGLGRNANEQKRWDDAIKQFDYVTKLVNDYSSVYSFRAEAYLGQEKWAEATDDLISALSIDWDRKALYLTTELKDPALTMMIAKMKVQAAKSPNEQNWPFVIGNIYENNKEYEKALEYYGESNAREVSSVIYYRMAICHSYLGEHEASLADINNALNMDSTDVDYMSLKANIFYEMGEPELAIREWDKVLEKYPDNYWGYYRRGWFKELTNQNDGAVDDLSMSIVLEPSYSYSYVSRGDVYLKQGKRELAEADFRKVIELEDSPEKYGCVQYAYHGIGMDDKAMAVMDSIIARDPADCGNYYDAACLYSRMGKQQEALAFLEKSLKNGYRRFAHMETDDDLAQIRTTDEYKRLRAEYNTKTEAKTDKEGNSIKEITSEVPFVKENGIYKVHCSINGLPLYFVFDTGASDVSLSLVEANFMMKNGYLSANDVVGSQRYIDANGDVSVGTVLNIKEVSFGDCVLNNVRASVVKSQRAPLLLGQSVLGRLGKIEIDNSRRVLKITHSGSK